MDKVAWWLVAGAGLAFFLLSAVFLSKPEIDIRVSALFYDGSGFPALHNEGLEVLRKLIRNLAFAFALFALALFILNPLALPQTRVSGRVTGFIFTSYLVGPGIVANAVLKEHWGRARPEAVSVFGGSGEFTPPLLPADQCAGNCSFVSGEAAAIFTSVLAFALVFLPGLGKRGRWCLVIAAAILVNVGSGLRIIKGKHFLSDVLFAYDFMTLTTVGLFLLFGLHRIAEPVSFGQVRRNLVALFNATLVSVGLRPFSPR